MRTHSFTVAVVFLMLLGLSAKDVQAQFQISWSTVGASGGISSGGSFTVEGSFGEPASGTTMSGGEFTVTGGFQAGIQPIIRGDINGDGAVNLLDVAPFVDLLSNGEYQPEGDFNQDGSLNLLDVGPFVDILAN